MKFKENKEKSEIYELIIKSFALVGFFVAIILILWGATFLIKKTPTILSNIGSAAVTLTSKFFPAEEKNNIDFVLSRNQIQTDKIFSAFIDYPSNKDKYIEGEFEVSYSCVENSSLKRISGVGTAVYFPCNTRHKIKEGNKMIEFKAISENKDPVEIFINLYFIEKGKETPSEVIERSIIVISDPDYTPQEDDYNNDYGNEDNYNNNYTDNNYEITAGDRTENNYNLNELESTENTNSFKQADLTGEIMEFGYIDENTNEFVADTNVPEEAKAAAKFIVENIGTKETKDWSFSLVLPTNPKRIFSSDSQRPLNSGERIEYTIGFDKFISNSEETFTLNIDPTGSVNEKTKDNNIIKEEVTFTNASSTEEN